tara:strand:- start:1118 stop:1468 length:351 start_codon:yes stop_codon:yes gene_type:complete
MNSDERIMSDLQALISEAHSENLDETRANEWARSHLAGVDYDALKDIAHHYGVPSVEIAHHSTVRAATVKAIVAEILEGENEDDESWDDYHSWDGSDNSVDGVYIEPNYDYWEEED